MPDGDLSKDQVAGRRRRARRWSMRARVTGVASVVLAAAVTGGVVLLYLAQISTVRKTVDHELRTYLAQLTAATPDGRWPDPLPGSSVDSAAQAQVLDAAGRVVAATANLAGRPATFALGPGSDIPIRLKGADGVLPNDVRAVGTRVHVAGEEFTMLAATTTALLSQLQSTFTRQLFWAFPVVLMLAAGAVWLLVGRALRPVERIRSAVAGVTPADLTARVPEPGTADEIGRLARTMNDMLGRLEDSDRRQRRFVADASHELRSPLAAIRTTLDVALAHPTIAPWPAVAATAVEQTERMQILVDQLLVLARAAEQTGHNGWLTVDLSVLLTDLRARTDPAGVELALDIPDQEVALIAGHPDQLARLFGNLLDNAVRYAATKVAVVIRVSGTTVRTAVDDDGPGIPEADRERVFNRFVRLDTSRDRTTGNSGLGLAIAREIATTHHGSVTISESAVGGTRLLVELPRVQPLPTPNPVLAPHEAIG